MKIAIRGHESRGKEVIQILESLGGRNTFNYNGDCIQTAYFIGMDYSIYGFCTYSPKVGFKVYTLEEFETQFPFKVGDKVTIVGLPDFPKIITKMAWDCDEILYSFEGLNNTWFGAKSLKRFEMKEERNITLTLDKAKEWYKKGGELREIALQAFSKKELNPLPRSWEEFCRNNPIRKEECVLDYDGKICTFIQNGVNRTLKNWIPSKKSAEAHLAMIQLEQLRNCWWGDWEPKWNASHKYAIKNLQSEITILGCSNVATFLVFPTKEMALEFLECFRDLIEQAGDLI